MKSTSLIAATIGAASAGVLYRRVPEAAFNTEMFEQNIGATICQAYDGFDFFDLNDFDKVNRDVSKQMPSVISGW